MYQSLFNHLPIEGYLDFFKILTDTSKAAMGIHIQFFCVDISFHFSEINIQNMIGGLNDK